MTEYTIYLLDTNRNRIAQVERYKRAAFVKRFNELGAWSIELDVDSPEYALLQWQYGVEVLRDDLPFMEGYYFGFDGSGIEPGVDSMTIFGPDLMMFLSTRVAVPDPAGPPYGVEFDVRTGAAGDVIKEYVTYNAGPLARATRKWSPLSVAAANGVGGSVTGRARFENLLDLCQKLALDGGDIQFYFSGTELECKTQTDKTTSVIFSRELDNVSNISRRVEAPVSNYIYAGGQGEGILREISETQDSQSALDYGRIEEFYDYRQGTGAELYTAALGRLQEKKAKSAIEVITVNTPSVQYGRDYDIGDIVKIVVGDNETYDHAVREVKIDLTPEGEQISEEIVFVAGSAKARLAVEEVQRLSKFQSNELGKRMHIMESI